MTEHQMQRTAPPFRADHVGSLLRPAALRDARARRASGAISAADLAAVEDREIGRILRRQEDIGLQSATDGEFRRSWWHLDFLWGLDGVERYLMDQGVAFSGVQTRPEGARVVGKVSFSGHPMIDHFRFVRARTSRLPKMTIPAPSAIYGRTGRAAVSRSVYPDLDAFFADVGLAYRKAVRAFADAGCRYLQLDEVYIAMLCDPEYRAVVTRRGDDPSKLLETYAGLINAAIADAPDGMTVTMHMCRGNYRSTFMGNGPYDAVAEAVFNRIKVHGYFMEYDTERAGGFEPLRLLPKDRFAVLGLVTTKTGRLESRDEILRRVDAASQFADIGQLCVSPQCGFASTEEGNVLAEDEQWAKLALVVDVAREVWG
jgi:5-methyltetrahydropteroyltriglutamate--homocysteine methyltransferase